MRKIFFLLILASLTWSSCTKMLDVEPTASISADVAIKDKDGVIKAILGAYNSLQSVGSYGRNQVIVQDLAADNLVWTGTTRDYQQIAENAIASDNGVIDGIWSANYDCINRVNNVLYRLPDIEMSSAERSYYAGHSLFLRALAHFNLLVYFGAVPVKTLPTLDLSSLNQARTPVNDVYKQIIADLKQAEQSLSTTKTIGLASSWSASALLARVYLTQFHQTSDPAIAALAIAQADHVITNGGFTLAANYADLFTNNISESIFEVAFDAQNYNRLAQYFFPVSLTGRYEVAPAQPFVQVFDSLDGFRFPVSVKFDEKQFPYGYKYRDIVSGTDRVYVIRLAEMYLIKAEALVYTNGDAALIRDNLNIIRTRASLPPVQTSSIVELKAAIALERRFEFAFESQRWSDLVRTKMATSVLGIDEKYTLFPIPLSELQTNKLMTQNPGY